jgi:hypothetical protein
MQLLIVMQLARSVSDSQGLKSELLYSQTLFSIFWSIGKRILWRWVHDGDKSGSLLRVWCIQWSDGNVASRIDSYGYPMGLLYYRKFSEYNLRANGNASITTGYLSVITEEEFEKLLFASVGRSKFDILTLIMEGPRRSLPRRTACSWERRTQYLIWH